MTSVAAGDPSSVTAPIPILENRPGWRESFTALGARNYRLYATSQLLDNTGGWMARIAVDWLVLELTGNIALVGLVITLQFAPGLLLGPWAGVLSDRYPRRRVLMITQSTWAICNATLAALTLLGLVEVWYVFIVAAVIGVAAAFDGPSRSAFVSEMVGTYRLRNAIGLNAMIFHLGGLIGPALSGILIGTTGSSGWSIAINAVTNLIALLALALMRVRELVPVFRQPRMRGQFREALRYAHRKPTIFWPIVLLAFVATFGMNLPVLFTASANETYGTGPEGYGLYSSLAAVGAVVGAIIASRRRSLRLRSIVFATIGYGLITALAGLTVWYPLFLGLLVGIGISRLLFALSAEAMTQLSTNPGIRGRIMAIYLTVAVGGQAAGGVIIGWVAETFGSTVAFLVAGGVPTIAAIVVGTVVGHRHQMRIKVDLRTPRTMVRIVRRGQIIREG